MTKPATPLFVTPETLGMSLSFNLESIELADVAKLSKGEGRFTATASEEIPEDERLSDTGDDDDDQRSLLVEGPWKEAPLADLFDGAMLKSLNKAGLKTVGDLAAWSAADKRLIDIPGIGAAKAEQIEETMERFWEENPGAGDDWGGRERRRGDRRRRRGGRWLDRQGSRGGGIGGPWGQFFYITPI